jgi:hypothetical protein
MITSPPKKVVYLFANGEDPFSPWTFLRWKTVPSIANNDGT